MEKIGKIFKHSTQNWTKKEPIGNLKTEDKTCKTEK